MADLSITATNVTLISGTAKTGTLGANLTAGTAVIASAGTLLAAKGDSQTNAAVVGILLGGGNSGQSVTYAGTPGDVVAIGATTVVGERYDVSVNAGKIAASGDQVTGNWVSQIAFCKTSGQLVLTLTILNIQHA